MTVDLTRGESAYLVTAAVVPFVLGFLLGAISPATILARLRGKDLRGSGSGNPGATNAGRVLGVRWGVVVGVLDVLKGYLPTVVAAHVIGGVYAAFVGLAVVLGHVFSPFLRGRGGKGVATTVGVLLAVAPWIALAGVVVFLAAFALRRKVGEASIVATVIVLIAGCFIAVGVLRLAEPLVGVALVLMCLVVLARHKRNLLVALRRGQPTE